MIALALLLAVVEPRCAEAAGRRFCFIAPEGKSRVPLVVYLHPNGGSGGDDVLGLQQLALERGYAYAFPDGAADETGRQSWNSTDVCCARPGPAGDDVAFLDAMLDELQRLVPIDPRRIYFAGHSLGAFMAHRYACDRSARVAAIASHAGATFLDAARCRAEQPVSVLQIHGDADTNINYGGGQATRTPNYYPSAHQTVVTWARKDHCKETQVVGDREQHSRCARHTRVELWTVKGGGHRPATSPELASSIYDWLEAHRRR